MRLSNSQKSERVVRFLRNATRPEVAQALAAHGFSQADWEEGWQKLQAAAGRWLPPGPDAAGHPSIIPELDAWENRWFPVAEAALRHRHPAVADKVFLNLGQASGLAVVITVSTFVQRLRALEQEATASEALALLRKRGLTEQVLGHAETLLDGLGDVAPSSLIADAYAAELARREPAEAALWAWYLEWAKIARNTIHDRNLLRVLGVVRPSAKSDPLPETDEDPPLDPPLPAPASSVPAADDPHPRPRRRRPPGDHPSSSG
jgi:hypothetical protein